MERKKSKNLMGWDNGCLTEQQTTITTILIRRMYKTNSEMHRAALTD